MNTQIKEQFEISAFVFLNFRRSCCYVYCVTLQEATLEELEQAFYDQFILKLTSMSIALAGKQCD